MDTYLIGLSKADEACYGTATAPLKIKDNLKPSDVSVETIKSCLNKCGLNIASVDFLISASSTPDLNNPSLSQTVLGRFENVNIGGIEIRQSAAGFNFALELADSFIKSGIYRAVLVLCAEFLARAFNAKFNYPESEKAINDIQKISSDAVFCCLACSGDFLRESGFNGRRYKLTESFVSSSDCGLESFYIPRPDSSRFPERLTKEDISKNLHLPHFKKSEFKDAAVRKLKPHVSRLNGKILIEHSPENGLFETLGVDIKKRACITDHCYKGSAGAGCSLLELEPDLASGDTVSLVAVGAGLNVGIAGLEVE